MKRRYSKRRNRSQRVQRRNTRRQTRKRVNTRSRRVQKRTNNKTRRVQRSRRVQRKTNNKTRRVQRRNNTRKKNNTRRRRRNNIFKGGMGLMEAYKKQMGLEEDEDDIGGLEAGGWRWLNSMLVEINGLKKGGPTYQNELGEIFLKYLNFPLSDLIEYSPESIQHYYEFLSRQIPLGSGARDVRVKIKKIFEPAFNLIQQYGFKQLSGDDNKGRMERIAEEKEQMIAILTAKEEAKLNEMKIAAERKTDDDKDYELLLANSLLEQLAVTDENEANMRVPSSSDDISPILEKVNNNVYKNTIMKDVKDNDVLAVAVLKGLLKKGLGNEKIHFDVETNNKNTDKVFEGLVKKYFNHLWDTEKMTNKGLPLTFEGLRGMLAIFTSTFYGLEAVPDFKPTEERYTHFLEIVGRTIDAGNLPLSLENTKPVSSPDQTDVGNSPSTVVDEQGSNMVINPLTSEESPVTYVGSQDTGTPDSPGTIIGAVENDPDD